MLSRLAILVALPAALAGQPKPAPGRSTAATIQFLRFADLFGGRLVAAFDSIPAARYDFRPAPSQQTVGYIAQHLEHANYGLCERIGGTKHPVTSKDSFADTIKARWPKDTLVARLDASLRYCDAALEHLGSLDSPAVVSSLLALETDLAEHYSQLAVYMRLLGLVPPSALPPRSRTVIALPSAALARYVGRYEISQGLELVVTLRNDALFIRSTPGGADARLWPESDTSFFVKESDAHVTFTRDARGGATGLVFYAVARPHPATKIR